MAVKKNERVMTNFYEKQGVPVFIWHKTHFPESRKKLNNINTFKHHLRKIYVRIY